MKIKKVRKRLEPSERKTMPRPSIMKAKKGKGSYVRKKVDMRAYM